MVIVYNFLLFRRFEITFAKHSNKKRRNVEIRRQEMVQVDSPHKVAPYMSPPVKQEKHVPNSLV